MKKRGAGVPLDSFPKVDYAHIHIVYEGQFRLCCGIHCIWTRPLLLRKLIRDWRGVALYDVPPNRPPYFY